MSVRDNILASLRALMPELSSKYNVQSLGLFGSVTREDFKDDSSDIDIIVEFSRPVGVEFIDLGNYLEAIFKRKVDLVSRKGIKNQYFEEIQNDILYV